jgi:hypothetical protein
MSLIQWQCTPALSPQKGRGRSVRQLGQVPSICLDAGYISFDAGYQSAILQLRSNGL